MGKTPEKENPEEKKKLEKLRSAAQRQKAKLYIIAACIALLVCGCSTKQQKRTCAYQ